VDFQTLNGLFDEFCIFPSHGNIIIIVSIVIIDFIYIYLYIVTLFVMFYDKFFLTN